MAMREEPAGHVAWSVPNKPRRLVRRRPPPSPFSGTKAEIALYLVSQGFSVLPCHFPLETGENAVCSCSLLPFKYQEDHSLDLRKRVGKHPFGRLAPHAADSATTDPDVIRDWLAQQPDLNFAVATGRLHRVGDEDLHLVVIDPDSAEAEERLRANIVMPMTFEVVTGIGKHLYYWTDVAMSNANGGLSNAGISNVDVRGHNGYVMAPGSLHWTGRVYTAVGSLSDIARASDGLRSHLVPYTQPRQHSRKSNISWLVDKLPKESLPVLQRDELPEDVVVLLDQDPPVGQRNPAAWKAILALLDVTDDDRLIAGSVLAFPVGKRYEGRKLSDGIFAEIRRARETKARTPEEQQAYYDQRHQMLVDKQFAAASTVLPTTTLRVLTGYQKVSIKQGGGKFAASGPEVAIEAGVHRNTVYPHRNTLVRDGWLKPVHVAGPGLLANTYLLVIPGRERASVCNSSQECGGLHTDARFLGAAPKAGLPPPHLATGNRRRINRPCRNGCRKNRP